MLSDLEIARATQLLPITQVAERFGIPAQGLTLYGPWKAKLDHRQGEESAQRARYVLVTAITPTPAGEGKTVHTIGLSLALNRLGKRAVCTLRQPSMGPVFGIKGGAAGGGYSQVVPMQDINLHLTGDFHAVAAANNLLAAAVDASLLLDNPQHLDPERISWRRVVDVNDRALRQIQVGLGGEKNGVPRETGFDITAASEVMAILGLASGWKDMRQRLGRVVVGQRSDGTPVSAEDIGAAGAMAALVREAVDPTFLQTTEGTAALMHTGPFANIAHGNSSIIADRVGARFFDYVVTEAGFGADMGAEKFFNIKCRLSGMRPDVAVLVATLRGLKLHSGRFEIRAGRLPPELDQADQAALEAGCVNLEAQIENLRQHGVPVVVAANRFASDSDGELRLVCERALAAGAAAAEVSELFAHGGSGGEALGRAVVEVVESEQSNFHFLYELEAPLREKLTSLATRLYGARDVHFETQALEALEFLEKAGYGGLPVCVAKTQYSLSHEPSWKGRPSDFTFPVRDIRLAAGAGFLVAYAGGIMTMPGLGRSPAYRQVDLDANGEIRGLF